MRLYEDVRFASYKLVNLLYLFNQKLLINHLITATGKNLQTPITVIESLCFAQVKALEISGRKPLLLCAPFRRFPPAAACQGKLVGSFRLAPRVLSSLATRQPFRCMMRSIQQLLLINVLRALTPRCGPNSVNKLALSAESRGLAFSRRYRPASVGLWSQFLQVRAFSSRTHATGRTSNTSVALQNQTNTNQKDLHQPTSQSQRSIITQFREK